MNVKVICPNCKQKTSMDKSNKFRPFCSERCRLIDLGEWFEESYTISEPASPEINPSDSKKIH